MHDWIDLAFYIPARSASFYFGLENCHFLDAIFESTSGLTTTGATIFKDFSELSYSLFLWRSLSQWIGA